MLTRCSVIRKGKHMSLEERQATSIEAERKPKLVEVTVDGGKREVQAGTYLVSDFKRLVGVDPSKELDEIVHGEFKPLADNAQITIEKHEKFVSHVRSGS